MAVRIDKNEIHVTRGDTIKVPLKICFVDGTEYVPQPGDLIEFGLKASVWDENCIFKKIIPTDTMELHILPNDTKKLPYGDYVYDIQITFANGDISTFITATLFEITGEVV